MSRKTESILNYVCGIFILFFCAGFSYSVGRTHTNAYDKTFYNNLWDTLTVSAGRVELSSIDYFVVEDMGQTVQTIYSNGKYVYSAVISEPHTWRIPASSIKVVKVNIHSDTLSEISTSSEGSVVVAALFLVLMFGLIVLFLRYLLKNRMRLVSH